MKEPLRLTARVEDRNERHCRITVFQNGANCGVLTVDAEHGDEVAGLLNGCVPLLAACEAFITWMDQPSGSLSTSRKLGEAAKQARAAIAQARGEKGQS